MATTSSPKPTPESILELILQEKRALELAVYGYSPTPKKIGVTHISQEYRAEWLFGETYWQPQRVAINWSEILSA